RKGSLRDATGRLLGHLQGRRRGERVFCRQACVIPPSMLSGQCRLLGMMTSSSYGASRQDVCYRFWHSGAEKCDTDPVAAALPFENVCEQVGLGHGQTLAVNRNNDVGLAQSGAFCGDAVAIFKQVNDF